jgi:hypothetical protein
MKHTTEESIRRIHQILQGFTFEGLLQNERMSWFLKGLNYMFSAESDIF